jgi:hypothetical protein
MTKDEALKMAIESLETAEVQSEYDGLSDMIFKAINACKEALEQPAWQGLTDKEDNAIIKKIWIWGNDFPYEKYRIAIEQALKDKNSV